MKVIAFDPFVSAERAKQLMVTMVSLEDLFKTSDFITIHTPLNATTKSIITEKEIALMKPSVRIINCARGGLIDEDLLAKAITEKKIAGAALDVFAKEPTTESPLFSKDNVVVYAASRSLHHRSPDYLGQRCRRADCRRAER